jgi:maltose O-acetyltransferase
MKQVMKCFGNRCNLAEIPQNGMYREKCFLLPFSDRCDPGSLFPCNQTNRYKDKGFIDHGKLGFVEGMMENCRKTERERMTNGESFFTNNPQLMEDKKNARILCSRFNSSPEDESLRKALLKQLFGHCGERIAIKPPFHCDYGYNIFAGDDLFINFDCVFLDAAPIRIGEHCMIGPKTCIYAIGHPLDAESRREKIGIPKPVTIGDNVWIGGGVTILPGVSIGDSTVIAAASVVTKSFPDHVVIAGNPAKIIKNIEE